MSFEPDFSLLKWEDNPRFMEAARSVRMHCPHCNAAYSHENTERLPGKYEMNLKGFWLKDGQTRRRDGVIVGEQYESDIASFWLKGVAAAFKDWKTIVLNFLNAEQEYHRTGSESSLQTTVNTDSGGALYSESRAIGEGSTEIAGTSNRPRVQRWSHRTGGFPRSVRSIFRKPDSSSR